MSFYPWNSPDSSEGSVVEGRLSDQITRRYGMTGYSEPARLRGAIAELLASGGFFQTNGILTPQDFGSVAGDATVTFQTWLDAIGNGQATGWIPAGTYQCGLLTDTSAGKLDITAATGAVIQTTAPTWLKVDPTGGKTGVRLHNLNVQRLSGNTVMTPMIWLEGSSAGGIVHIDINNLTLGGASVLGDGLWLRACFNGSVRNLFGTGMGGGRAVVYEALDFNSGNIHFDTLISDAAVTLQLGGAFSSVANGSLLNTIHATNIKAVRSTGGGVFDTVTLTAGASAGADTLTVSAPDASAIAANLSGGKPQWVVGGDASLFGNVHRISAAAGTTLTLDGTLRAAIANTSVLPVGSFGVVIGANVRGIDLDSVHAEFVGGGVICSGGQQVQIKNPIFGSGVVKGVYCTNGSQNIKCTEPIYSKANTGLTLMETTAQGTNARCTLREPAGYSSGAGPLAFLTDGAAGGFNNRYLPEADSMVARQVTADPMDATAGNRPKAAILGEIVQYTDFALYVCVTYAANPTWAKVGGQ